MTYCRPWNAGLASETPAVCRRIGRLLQAMDDELTAMVVEGEIVEDVRQARMRIADRLRAEGWTMSYDGSNRLKVRQPGHRKPFK